MALIFYERVGHEAAACLHSLAHQVLALAHKGIDFAVGRCGLPMSASFVP